MAKYDEATVKKAVEMAKNGKALKEIQREVGPNPSAIKRYAKKMGVALPKRGATPKSSSPKKKVVAKKAPAKKTVAKKKTPAKR